MSAGAAAPPAGVLISERALLAAQRAKIQALERLGESQRDAELVAAAALVNRLRAMLRGTGEAEVWDARADIRDLLDVEGFRP